MTPPHDITGKVITEYLSTSENAKPLIELMKKSYDLLKDHPVNLARKKLSIEAERELDGYEIVNADTKYQIKNDQCVMTGYYIVRYADD